MRVLITGGGTGIGRACAESLAEHGADVIICGRTLETLEIASEEIQAAHNTKVEYLICDVTEEESVEECLSKADWMGGHLYLEENSDYEKYWLTEELTKKYIG